MASEQNEIDDRFPSGEWTGFYLQPDSNERNGMNCHLQFVADAISGGGDDPVGQYTIRGAYNTRTAECSWLKQYLGQHAVTYVGEARAGGIVGRE